MTRHADNATQEHPWSAHRKQAPVAVDNRLGGGYALSRTYHQAQGSRAVRQLIPVEATFSAEDDAAAFRGAARRLADDLDQQFGVAVSTIPA
ncbi:hypothetical protein P3102_18160 [Amycolatopsis sp. QT-25]|uniref:hypothetical protein n=1 Tax=Amycolatopsis sp. QT-25 TaxID=3034022 RepID=UPI0023EB8B4F|nr:hypothetical protein [Amycolatopsis sp. QT-25]WET82991.1 hypothetical protein P3102_18160 [Amycolatopsis sp. QT-25]